MDTLQQAREIINEVDSKMAELFARRMRAVQSVAQYKQERGMPIFDAEREKQVIARNSLLVEDPQLRTYYARFLQLTMDVSKQYQRDLLADKRVAYSGVEGAFAYIAARRIFPERPLVSQPDFQAAYHAVESGDCQCCILPIENSYAGEVGQVMDLVFNGSLYVNGVYSLPITQNLLAAPGAAMEDIHTVFSHPQALAQCANYIHEHGFVTKEAANTALAAQQIAQSGSKNIAAIASAETASLYGLQILERNINESSANTTRFAVLSRVQSAPASTTENRFMLLFTVKNTAGALAKAINVIGSHGFNLLALRSRPMRELPWQYYFYAEAEGDENTQSAKEMIAELSSRCAMLKVAGHYAEDICLKGEEE